MVVATDPFFDQGLSGFWRPDGSGARFLTAFGADGVGMLAGFGPNATLFECRLNMSLLAGGCMAIFWTPDIVFSVVVECKLWSVRSWRGGGCWEQECRCGVVSVDVVWCVVWTILN